MICPLDGVARLAAVLEAVEDVVRQVMLDVKHIKRWCQMAAFVRNICAQA